MSITAGWPFSRVNAPGTKHELTRTGLHTHLSGNLKYILRDILRLTFNVSGVLPFGGVVPMELTAGVANDTVRVSSGCGVLNDSALDHAGLVDWTTVGDVEFENAAGSDYYFGFQVHEVPLPTSDGVRANSSSGVVEYIALRLEVGMLAHPDAVTDLGAGQVRLRLDTLCAGGGVLADHGDRAVRAWLDQAVDPDAAVAFPTGTAAYAGGHYDVDLGDCGQLARSGAVSVDPNDYWVIMPGLAVSKTTDITALSTYLGIGSAAGSGPGAPAVVTDTAYRYGSALGTLNADVWTLYRDLYTTPHRDGDGLANLTYPLETLVKEYATTADLLAAGLAARQHGAVAPFDNQHLRGTAQNALMAAADVTGFSDGQYYWTHDSDHVVRHVRSTGAVDGTSADFGTIVNICSAGGHVLMLYYTAPGAAYKLAAVDRAALTVSYEVDTGFTQGADTPLCIETDGHYTAVSFASAPGVKLYHDTGAALVLDSTYDHGIGGGSTGIAAMVMDGSYLVAGGDTGVAPSPGVGCEIVVLTYPTLTFLVGHARAGAANVDQVAFDGQLIAYSGDSDGVNRTGVRTMRGSADRWAVADHTTLLTFTRDGELACKHDGVSATLIYHHDLVDGEIIDLTQGPTTALVALSYDHDMLFAFGVSGANNRLYWMIMHTETRLYSVYSADYPFRANHSLVQPVR